MKNNSNKKTSIPHMTETLASVQLPRGYFFTGVQPHVHFLLFAIPALFVLFRALAPGSPIINPGAQALGMGHSPIVELLFFASIAVPVVHQWIVWFFWRAQLSSRLLTRIFGRFDLPVWGFIFMPFLIARFVLLVLLAATDNSSLDFLTTSIIVGLPAGAAGYIRISLALLFLGITGFGIWSVMRYFGLVRALGADHFREHYRHMPLETRGAYRYSSNVMYGMVFLAFWAIALLGNSVLALVSAAFQQAYIWVHYYCTEEPDMRLLYAAPASGSSNGSRQSSSAQHSSPS